MPEPMPPAGPLPLTDSHAHLTMAEFDHDRAAVLARFWSAGGTLLIVASDDLPAARAARDLAASDGRLRFIAGVHPHHARELTADEWRGLAELLAAPRCAGLGEIGLDYHYDHAPRTVQRVLYDEQLRFAAERGVPVVLHAREADADIIAGARPYLRSLPPGILHCYSGSAALAETFLAQGWLISVAGPATYPRSDVLRAAVRAVPPDSLLSETDAPYLAPQRWRGKRNEPAYIAEALAVMAELHGLTPTALAGMIEKNMRRFLALTENKQCA